MAKLLTIPSLLFFGTGRSAMWDNCLPFPTSPLHYIKEVSIGAFSNDSGYLTRTLDILPISLTLDAHRKDRQGEKPGQAGNPALDKGKR